METTDGSGGCLDVTLSWWGHQFMQNLVGFDQLFGGVFVERKSSGSKWLFLLTVGDIVEYQMTQDNGNSFVSGFFFTFYIFLKGFL